MIAGLYRAGDSPLHRTRPGLKLLSLAIAGTALLALSSLWLAGAAMVLIFGLYCLAGFGLRTMIEQVRPAAFILAILAFAQLWLAGPSEALLFVTRFAVLILAAGLVTLTTRTSDLVTALEVALSPLSRFGLNVSGISLAISLAIRFIPAIGQILSELREAQIARGRKPTVLTLVVPMIIRLLKMADSIAEAIDARS
ncbi:energy-coupling factor transporter transmembrane protein EcfT [Jiella sp. MQZ9-1]|uniref:Energy-coupling factor transporter transmembrane protein EcfT n=1 Tax=Jiella flava TaxID=2816857 RepID=A0A939FVZ2_9HYPH|nr:energy-coupling factor transporter transmembrane protein EcfT [Jiella flava]MBO0661256.1 energy-coupling factor transporter transmembrane protein EcfT [Jiella flava]MCD2469901.1 energy-coupling factor transporter transmembrane protein EcfT [Jiella flava]